MLFLLSAACRCLAAALGDLESQGLMDEHKVSVRVMNPKAVTMGQLYGQVCKIAHADAAGHSILATPL